MVSIRINGSDAPVDPNRLGKLTDLLEVVKTMIDPDHMITGILLDGKELDDADWSRVLTPNETTIVEVETGSPANFVIERLQLSSKVIAAIYTEFRDARKSFQDGSMNDGNRVLVSAVKGLKAFFEWFGSLIELLPVEQRGAVDIRQYVEDISAVCKRICQQQLYQSWWAIGESIEKELEPKLDALETFLRRVGKTQQ